MSKPKLLVITPIKHIPGVWELLASFTDITYLPEATFQDVLHKVPDYDALYTNPNKSNVFLAKDILDAGQKLKVICTASTGTDHIDKTYAAKQNVSVLSLTEERDVINTISSTAEHAFALMMSALRKIPQSWDSVKSGLWDYEPFIGRQVDHLTVGVVGYGRLGGMFSRYAKAFGARTLVYDPYKKVEDTELHQVDLSVLLKESDVISFHVHVTKETTGMVDHVWFSQMKSNVLLINTARGDIINEPDLIRFLEEHPQAFYATDVLSKETESKQDNPILNNALSSPQILITPHIGGMTVEGQSIAYIHAAKMLKAFLAKEAN